MSLPKKIEPNPLLTSTVEIRFIDGEESKILPILLGNLYGTEFTEFKRSEFPPELKDANEQFKYLPDYILSSENYSLSFSDKAVGFENIGEYKYWDNYFPFIKKCLKIIFDNNLITTVERIGLRYSSIFSNDKYSISEILNSTPSINITSYKEEEMIAFSTYFNKDDRYKLYLRLNSRFQNEDSSSSYLNIDIDASMNIVAKYNFDEICKIIDDLHNHEKELFSSLVRKEFLEKEFNVTY